MIHHISIPAQRPLKVAKVLVELLDGMLTKFGPNTNSYIAWSRDEFGTAIEVFPAGTELHPDTEDAQANFRYNDHASSFSTTHAAVSVARSTADVLAIAEREEWRAIELSRGSFRVIEFWIENHFLIEIMTVEMTREYLKATAVFRRVSEKRSD